MRKARANARAFLRALPSFRAGATRKIDDLSRRANPNPAHPHTEIATLDPTVIAKYLPRFLDSGFVVIRPRFARGPVGGRPGMTPPPGRVGQTVPDLVVAAFATSRSCRIGTALNCSF